MCFSFVHILSQIFWSMICFAKKSIYYEPKEKSNTDSVDLELGLTESERKEIAQIRIKKFSQIPHNVTISSNPSRRILIKPTHLYREEEKYEQMIRDWQN